MRSWKGATSSFAGVVMMAALKVRFPSSAVHLSYIAANPITRLPRGGSAGELLLHANSRIEMKER